MVVHQKRNIHVPYRSEDTKKMPGTKSFWRDRLFGMKIKTKSWY